MPVILLGSLPQIEPDCACPVPPEHEEDVGAEAGQWRLAAELYQVPLFDAWTLCCNPLAGGAPAVLNQSALKHLATFATPRVLVDDADRSLARARLVVPQTGHVGPPTRVSSVLTAWLHVTNACNLDCPYCYIRKSTANMSVETGRVALDALVATARQRGFTTLKLKYAGGEAALHYRLVQQLHAYAISQCQRYGLSLEAVVLSNGTVMPAEFADWLATSGVRLMLSVDGYGRDHDVQRPWKSGLSGSFAALERNLVERILPRGVRPDICITVTGRTAQTAVSAVRWAMHYDLPFTLNFYRENEQSATHRELRYEDQQLIDGLLHAYAAIEDALPARSLFNGLLDHVQAQAHGHTCGVGQNYVVITHTGTAAQCQMHQQHAQPFDASSDLIQLVASGPIHNVSVDEKEGCRTCLWRYRCAGGCPLVTLRVTGRTDIRSPNCHIYQALLPAALRLEGLRLLKMASVDATSASCQVA